MIVVMGNMLNQFYKYLANRILEFYKENEIKSGERYYIELDREEATIGLYNAISRVSLSEEFVYENPSGGFYKTYSFTVSGVKIIVAATIDVSTGFLVTLRNKISQQTDQWQNTSLLIISNKELDSISAGSASLQKEGMPLNLKSITENLIKLVSESKFSRREEEVLKFYLRKKLEDNIIYTSLWDYEEILDVIISGELKNEIYYYLQLFYDSDLDKYTTSKMKRRLQKNSELFEKVKNCHDYENPENQLEKYFDDKGVSLLKGHEWYQLDFTKVLKSNENSDVKDKALIYEESSQKLTDELLTYWEKNLGNSKVSERKRHIIVFNTKNLEEVNLTFKFNEILSKKYIGRECKDIVTTSGERLLVKLNTGKDVFYQRVLYTHKGQSKSKFEFNIVVLPVNESDLEGIKSNYIVNCKKRNILVDGLWDRVPYNESEFILNINGFPISFEVNEVAIKTIPVDSFRIWKEKRELCKDFSLITNNKVIQGNKEYYIKDEFRSYLEIEQEIISKEILFGIYKNGKIENINLSLPKKIKEEYIDILQYFKKNNKLPSLVYLNKELMGKYKRFLESYNELVEKIEENSILSELKGFKDLFHIGVIKRDGKMFLSPLSPLNMAFELKTVEELQNEFVPKDVLKGINGINLLPYIYSDENKVLRSINNEQAIQWIIYDNIDRVSLTLANKYIYKLVRDNIEKFIKHNKYLFFMGAKAPIKLNFINISNDTLLVRGIILFLKKQLEVNDISNIIPVEINIYNKILESSLDYLFSSGNVNSIEEKYSLSLKSSKYDEIDVLRFIQENIRYWKHREKSRFEYSHITFYKIEYEGKNIQDNMTEIETGVELNGLMSQLGVANNRSSYRVGFGSGNLPIEDNLLIRTTININKLGANLVNSGDNPYKENNTIVTKAHGLKEDEELGLYENSNWITFIDGNLNNRNFQDKIHFVDNRSITIVNENEKLNEIIGGNTQCAKILNSLKGELLLDILSSKINNKLERLTISQGISEVMELIEEENTIWIPIILDKKYKDKSGLYRENILFVGVKIRDRIKFRLYPMEIQVGYKFNENIDLYENNIEKIWSEINSEVLGERFENKVIRTKLMKKALLNSENLTINNLWINNNYEELQNIKSYLMRDEFDIDLQVEENLGKGIVLAFVRNIKENKIIKENECLYVTIVKE